MADSTPTKKAPAKKAAAKKAAAGTKFTADERAAMKEYAAELTTTARRGKATRADGEADLLASIAKMPDDDRDFFHDVPPERVAESQEDGRRPGPAGMWEDPWPLAAWPDVPTRVLLCRDDRFFPAPFVRRMAHDRLGITPDEMDGGHLPALARPEDLAARLLALAQS